MPPKRRKLRALPEVVGDIKALPTQKLKEIALQRISDVVNGRLSGARLEDMSRTGDLTDCFKLYFDETGGPARHIGSCTASSPKEPLRSWKSSLSSSAKSFMCTHSLRFASDVSPRVLEYQNDPSPGGLGRRREGSGGSPPRKGLLLGDELRARGQSHPQLVTRLL